MHFTKWTAVRLLGMVAVILWVWAYNYDRLSPSSLNVPIDYFEDTPMVLSFIEVAKEGDFVPFFSKKIHRLGAPYIADWNDWPMWDEPLVYGLGLLARAVGLLRAANLAVVIGYVLTGLAFYACCRMMRFQREWSFVAAVLFAFSFYHAFRNLHHLLNVYSFTIPFALLVCWWVAFSRRLQLWDWRGRVCLGTAFVIGLSSPYNLNMFAQFLCLATGVQLLGKRRKPNLQIAFVAFAAMIACFLLTNLDTFLHQARHGKNPEAMSRGYYETELFALKPIELAIPPTAHKLTALAKVGSAYFREAWIRGEVFSPYLGVIALGSLIWLGAEAVLILLKRRKSPRRFPVYAPMVLWVMMYSVVGGLNCFIGIAGLPLFRGTNRYSIFISALVLMFLASRLTRLSRNWRPALKYSVATTLLLAGLFDQLPLRTSSAQTQFIARLVSADRSFAKAMEEKLPPGAMVFQLPVMPFPESTPVNNLQAYELLRPFFYTKTLRFSFGTNKGRPREDWQKELQKLPPEQMVAALESYGFAALYLNRKGFTDQAQGLLKQLADLGRNQIIEDDLQEQVCVMLKPAPNPVLPPAGTRIPVRFVSGRAQVVPSPSGEQWWTTGNATLTFQNLDQDYLACKFTSQMASLVSRRVWLELNGKEIASVNLAPGQLTPFNVTFDAVPGNNRLMFKTDVLVRPTQGDPVPRAFVLLGPLLNRAAPATP